MTVIDDDLTKLCTVLQSNPHIILDKLTLVYAVPEVENQEQEQDQHQQQQHGLTGLINILPKCGQRINVLGLECSDQTFFTCDDLALIAKHCPLLGNFT